MKSGIAICTGQPATQGFVLQLRQRCASSIATSHISKRFEEISSVGNKDDAVNWMQSVITEANVEIFKYVAEHPESTGMGTTVVMAILTDNFLLFGNIGDSSGFVMKGGKLHKVTYDHTLVNLLVSAGELTEEEAKDHPKKNVLMKALGASLEIDVDIFDCDMDITGVFLSSDGLTNMLEREQIEKVLIGEGTVEEKLVKLIRKANNRGGTDNISVAYVDFREGDE